VVKLDFFNAFNSLHRFDMLSAVYSRIPDLYSYCCSAYSQPSVLFYGPHTVLSHKGPHQDDPLGSLLFCNTIHPMLSSLKSDLKLGYMDDVSLGGPVDTVGSDILEISKVGSSMGFTLNPSKCELIAHQDLSVKDDCLLSFVRVNVSDATLLGAPLFPVTVLDKAWSDRCADLARAVDRLDDVSSQDVLIVLMSFFSAPKVLHLRCSPSVNHSSVRDTGYNGTYDVVAATTVASGRG